MRERLEKEESRNSRCVFPLRKSSSKLLLMFTFRMITGDRIVVVVQKQRNFGPEGTNSSTGIANKVRRGDIRHAVIVRVRKEMQRLDGSRVKFDDNACVLVNKSGDPIGTRMNGQSLSAGISTATILT